ncbi:hypothetical protein OIDMADRAFT_21142, partial [Oidiodendron maius Zn]
KKSIHHIWRYITAINCRDGIRAPSPETPSTRRSRENNGEAQATQRERIKEYVNWAELLV